MHGVLSVTSLCKCTITATGELQDADFLSSDCTWKLAYRVDTQARGLEQTVSEMRFEDAAAHPDNPLLENVFFHTNVVNGKASKVDNVKGAAQIHVKARP